MSFPHHYAVSASCQIEGSVRLNAPGLPELASQPPKQFGGPGDAWSPEDLLCAAVADCFCLSFRAIAAASKFAYTDLHCEAIGTLDRVERAMLFTEFKVVARLTLPAGADTERGQKLLEKAEQTCLITNSLKSSVHLEATVVTQ
jgi:organic hydroperoxide reductase OsmC/OhrA